MQEQLLLQVTDVVALKSELLLHPSPGMPADRFEPCRCDATFELPDGSRKRRAIALAPAHLSLVGGECNWTVSVIVPDAKKDEVPRGTRVFVDESTARELQLHQSR
jgi:hypothetical protein